MMSNKVSPVPNNRKNQLYLYKTNNHMNVFEKELINAFFSPVEREYNRAIEIMFFGNNQIAATCRKVVNLCFQGPHYREAKMDGSLYRTFVSLFCLALRQKEDKVRKVKNLSAWMFRVVMNFCNQYRNEINYLIGLNPYGNSVPFDQKYDINDGGDESLYEETAEKEGFEDETKDQPSDSDPIPVGLIDVPDETDQPDDSNHFDSADDRLNRYLDNLLSSGRKNARYYHDLIVDVHIFEMTRKEVAAKYGRPTGGIDTDLQNAREALAADNIDAIRKKGRSLFNKYGTLLSRTHYEVLEDFYSDKSVAPNLAAKAWRALLKISVRKEKELINTAKKEDRKMEKKEKKIKKYGL